MIPTNAAIPSPRPGPTLNRSIASMLKTTGLASLAFLTLAPGCAGEVGRAQPDESSDEASDSKADSVIGAQTQTIGAVLGQGWDRGTETFKAPCVTGRVSSVPVGPRAGMGSITTTMDASSVEAELGFDIKAKGHYAMVDASLAAKVAQAVKQDDYSSVFVFKMDYDLGGEALDGSVDDIPSTGGDARRNNRWPDVCGDEVVVQINSGAKFYFVQRIDFSSREEKSRFEAEAHLGFSAGVSSGQIDAALQQIGHKYAKSARTHIEIYQFGGDPTQLGAVLNGTGGARTGAQAVVDCDMDHLEACKTVRANAVRYTDPRERGDSICTAPGCSRGGETLPNQLRNSRYARNPITYVTQPWITRNRNTTPRIITQQIQAARSTLASKFDVLLKWKLRIQRLLANLTGFGIPPEQQTDLTTWNVRLTDDLALVNSAVVACYDSLVFDPQGTPLATLVTACQRAVDAVPNDQPPSALLTAAGGYAIDYKWNLLGGVSSVVGDYTRTYLCFWNWRTHRRTCSTGPRRYPEATGRDQIGLVQQFEKGQIYWSADTDAHEVHGDILAKYLAMGGANPGGTWALGFPISDQSPRLQGGGATELFQEGSLYWKPGIGAFETHGQIRDKYWALHAENAFLGYPTSDVFRARDNGSCQRFEGDASSPGYICLRPGSSEPFEVHGPIGQSWASHGWDTTGGVVSALWGYPLSDEISEEGGDWHHSDFEGGSIYYNKTLQNRGQQAIFELTDAIANKYREVRDTVSGTGLRMLGYPTSEQRPTPVRFDNVAGQFQSFQRGGIYWTPRTGAHAVNGPIYDKWAQFGFESGRTLFWVSGDTLGYPVSDELPTNDFGQVGRFTAFEHGSVVWSPTGGAHVMAGDFLIAWGQQGYETGTCGFPTSDPSRLRELTLGHDYYRQEFQHCFIKYWPGPHTVKVCFNEDNCDL